MKKILYALMPVVSVSTLFAQTQVDPEIAFTETIDVDQYADYIRDNIPYDVSDDYSVRTFKAEISAASTSYIPLGTFNHGHLHRLAVGAAGVNATSSADYTFTVNATRNPDGIHVHQVLQRDHGSHFKIYAIKDGNLTSLVMRYTNTAPASNTSNRVNIVRVNHTSQGSGGWRPISSQTLLDNFLALSEEDKEALVLKGGMELHTGAHVGAGGFFTGIQFNQPIKMEQDVDINGDLRLNGASVLTTADTPLNISGGNSSIAFGLNTSASGLYSTTFGNSTLNSQFAGVSVGQYNENIGTNSGINSWQGDDLHSVFEVGVGISQNERENALTVKQDGSVELGKTINNEIPMTVGADGSIILNGPVILNNISGDIPTYQP